MAEEPEEDKIEIKFKLTPAELKKASDDSEMGIKPKVLKLGERLIIWGLLEEHLIRKKGEDDKA